MSRLKKIELEVFSEESNVGIVRMPGRAFPGCVVQGDSLSILVDLATELSDSIAEFGSDEMVEVVTQLLGQLRGRLAHYESVLLANEMDLPYSRKASPQVIPSAALNLVVLRCRNLEFSTRFFEAIGLRFHQEQHGSGPSHFSAASGSAILELYPHQSNHAVSQVRLGFRVADASSTVERVLAVGGRLVTLLTPSEWGRRAVIEHPDGHQIEIVDRVDPDQTPKPSIAA